MAVPEAPHRIAELPRGGGVEPAEYVRIEGVAREHCVLHIPRERHGDRGHSEPQRETEVQALREHGHRHGCQRQRGDQAHVLHSRGSSGERACQDEAAALRIAHEPEQIPRGERHRKRDAGLDEGGRRLPDHERLREEDGARKDRTRPSGDPLGEAHDGCERDEREQQRCKRSLHRVPQQHPVEHEHLDGERLVRRRVPRDFEDAMRLLEEVRIGYVVEDRVRRGDRRGHRDEVDEDVEREQRKQSELPPRPVDARSRAPASRSSQLDRPDERRDGEERQVGGRIEESRPACGEREQDECERTHSDSVEKVETGIADSRTAKEDDRAEPQPGEERRGSQSDVTEQLSQLRASAARRRRALTRSRSRRGRAHSRCDEVGASRRRRA